MVSNSVRFAGSNPSWGSDLIRFLLGGVSELLHIPIKLGKWFTHVCLVDNVCRVNVLRAKFV